MRFDVLPPGEWEKECEVYRASLPFAAAHVHVHAGFAHALWEVTQSLARTFSHKKKIAILKNWDPAFEDVAQKFSAEEFDVIWVSADEFKTPAAWFDAHQADLLFVLYDIDDPFTGRLFDCSAFEAHSKDKRVFRVALSHAAHTQSSSNTTPGPFDVRILSLSRERALAIGGERFRAQPIVSPMLPWSGGVRDSSAAEMNLGISSSASEAERIKQNVLAFESALPAGFKAYFASGDARVFDRIVIYHPDFDGSAVAEELARECGIQMAPLGAPGAFESTSACRWESPRLNEWLIAREGAVEGDSEARVRGLVVISSDILAQGLALKLAAVAQRLRALMFLS